MYPTAYESAAVIAAILKRSEQSRARISGATIRKVSRRRSLRGAFRTQLNDALIDAYGWTLVELASGGFGVIEAKALEAAKPVTGIKYLTAEERKAIIGGKADYDAFHTEAVGDEDEDPDEE